MATKPKLPVVVTVDDAHLPGIRKVAAALRRAGLSVRQVLPVAGIITGSAADRRLPALRAVPGVAAVEPDQEMKAI